MAGRRRATIYLRNGVFYVSYYREGKRIHESTGTPDRKLAEAVRRRRDAEEYLEASELERQVLQALRDPSRRSTVLAAVGATKPVVFQEAVEEYLTHSASYKRPKTIAADRGRLRDFWASTPVKYLSEVTTKIICEYMARRSNAVSPTTLLRFREALHAFFEWAIDRAAYTTTNPVAKVPRPKLVDHDIEYLPLSEIPMAPDAVAGDVIEGVVATAIYAGLRREELCWLTWPDVELDSRLIRVRSKSIGDESWMPKTKKNRTVPVSTKLHPFLLAQKLRHSLWVFPSPEGCRWDPDNLSHRLRAKMSAAGRAWGFLTFRHTFGSLLAQKGLSFEKISNFMGNSPAVVAKHYAQLRPEQGHAEIEFARLDDRAEVSY